MIELTILMEDDARPWGFTPAEVRDRVAERIVDDFAHLDVKVEVVA